MDSKEIKKRIALLNKVNKSESLSLFGKSVAFDWLLIIITAILLLFILFGLNYQQYKVILSQLDENRSDVRSTTIDEEKFQAIIDEIETRNVRLEALLGSFNTANVTASSSVNSATSSIAEVETGEVDVLDEGVQVENVATTTEVSEEEI